MTVSRGRGDQKIQNSAEIIEVWSLLLQVRRPLVAHHVLGVVDGVVQRVDLNFIISDIFIKLAEFLFWSCLFQLE